MQLSFLGATGTVTGSKYLIEHRNTKILIDCGLFQGHKELRLRNWSPLPIDPSEIDAVVLTHAHIDHSGYIPLLVKNGFSGNIYCSEATYDLCSILLPDSGYLQEEDAKRANKYGYSKHKKALPLYTQEDATDALSYFQTVNYGQKNNLDDSLNFKLSHSGHILGSAFITLSDGEKSIVFSGDLGRLSDPVMRPPVGIPEADYLVIESTYGDRLHKKTDPIDEIGEIINSTVGKGGSVIIPSFAVGRAQSILFYIYKLKESKQIPDIPVFLDSPMAINATKLLCKHADEHCLDERLCGKICRVAKYTKTVQESISLNSLTTPSVIISASGMATGGRILHHLKYHIGDSKCTILFAGFQAGGTRGDRLVRGEKQIKIHGEMHPVKARIEILDNLSAHADYEEILTWLKNFKTPPIKTFITHGEKKSASALKLKIEEQLGWDAMVPEYLQKVKL